MFQILIWLLTDSLVISLGRTGAVLGGFCMNKKNVTRNVWSYENADFISLDEEINDCLGNIFEFIYRCK